MAGSKTAYGAKRALDVMLHGAVPPGQWWAALSFDAFNADMTGSVPSELTPAQDPGYARVQLTVATLFGSYYMAHPTSAASQSDIAFPVATGDWADMPTSVYLCESATGNDAVYGADLPVTDAVLSGEQFVILTGRVVLTES